MFSVSYSNFSVFPFAWIPFVQPQCVGCDAPFTVRHFLLKCGDFAQVRNNCFHVDNMKELFQDIHIDSIMTFLRQINLFNKI